MGRLRRRTLLRVGLGLLVVAVLLQLVPLGRAHTNPPVRQDAPWPDGRTRELARTACYDCHSNQTRWPPQSYVAPFSWLITRDVEQGREKLNLSDRAEDSDEASNAWSVAGVAGLGETTGLIRQPGRRRPAPTL
jgi:Haem-binding domain